MKNEKSCFKVACYIQIGATTGSIDRSNYLCILSNNLFNQKYFLVLWLWWVSISILSVLGILYRLARIAVPDLSRWVFILQALGLISSYLFDNYQGRIKPIS